MAYDQQLADTLAECIQLRAWANDEQLRRHRAEEERLAARSEVARLRAELTAARDALRNDFEPDNQSSAYERASAALEQTVSTTSEK